MKKLIFYITILFFLPSVVFAYEVLGEIKNAIVLPNEEITSQLDEAFVLLRQIQLIEEQTRFFSQNNLIEQVNEIENELLEILKMIYQD